MGIPEVRGYFPSSQFTSLLSKHLLLQSLMTQLHLLSLQLQGKGIFSPYHADCFFRSLKGL